MRHPSEESPNHAAGLLACSLVGSLLLILTTLGPLQHGDPVNLETDVLAKYVEKQLAGEEA